MGSGPDESHPVPKVSDGTTWREARLSDLLIRIHAGKADLDFAQARRILEWREDDPALAETYADEDEGVAGGHFAAGEGSGHGRGGSRLAKAGFRNATDWLRQRTPDQIRSVREKGMNIDICIVGHSGPVPGDFLREVVRLELDLWIIGRLS